jgi:hypothetical protein
MAFSGTSPESYGGGGLRRFDHSCAEAPRKESAGSGAPGSAGAMGDLAGADGAAGARWGREGAAQSAKRADDGRNEPYGLGLADE